MPHSLSPPPPPHTYLFLRRRRWRRRQIVLLRVVAAAVATLSCKRSRAAAVSETVTGGRERKNSVYPPRCARHGFTVQVGCCRFAFADCTPAPFSSAKESDGKLIVIRSKCLARRETLPRPRMANCVAACLPACRGLKRPLFFEGFPC